MLLSMSLLVGGMLLLAVFATKATNNELFVNEKIEKEHAKFMESRRQLQHAVHAPDHTKDWLKLEVVDGLKNTEVAVFVTSTTNDNEHLLWERIIPSARTWMRLFAHVYVIVEDNFLIRYALRHCQHAEYPSYTIFSCHNEPHYLLTRNCTNEYYQAKGICCKIDDAINFISNENPALFEQVKYLIEGDDDTFFRPDQIMRWLAAVENSGVSTEIPLVANAEFSARPATENHDTYLDGGGVWHIQGCGDIKTNGWYQPLMLNKKALERLKVASKAYGFMKTCEAFDVSQDVGFGPFAWLMELQHIHMPGVEINGGHQGESVFRPNLMAIHDIKHHPDDFCDQPEKWPPSMRYNQKIVVGCGDLNVIGPFHNSTIHEADMYDAWDYYLKNGQDLRLCIENENDFAKVPVTLYTSPDGKSHVSNIVNITGEYIKERDGQKYYKGGLVQYRVIPFVTPLQGFRETSFAANHDLSQKWDTFFPKDCKMTGKLSPGRKRRLLGA